NNDDRVVAQALRSWRIPGARVHTLRRWLANFERTRRWSERDSNPRSLSRGCHLILGKAGAGGRSGWSRKTPSLFQGGPAVRLRLPPAASRTNSESGRRRTSIKHHRTVHAVEATAPPAQVRRKGGLSPDSAGPARPTNSVDSRPCIIRQPPEVRFARHTLSRCICPIG